MLWVNFKPNYRWRIQVGYSFSHGSAYHGSKWYRFKSWFCYSIICDPCFERYNWSCKIKIQTRRQRLLLWWRITIQVFTPQSVSVRKKIYYEKWIVFELKSEVAIASLFRQIQQPDVFLLEEKTITKSTGNGIAESFKFCNLHKKGRILWF